MRSKALMGLITLVIFSTGLTGLVYQVAWQKYLSRLLGSDSIATAIILATFLGGLSAGYYLCGRMTMRVRNHFKGYALLEGAIGAWCLLFPRTFELVERLTAGWSFSPPGWIVLQGFLCCALLIGFPTVCMGGTIPFLTRGLSRSVGEATGVHARVYAVNTAGAFLGTLLAGFYLVPAFGLPLTVMGTSVLNFGACLFFYLLAAGRGQGGHEPEIAPAGAAPESAAGLRHVPAVLYAIAFLSGFYVMTLENVLIRIVNLSLGSSSYSFSLIVAAFILAIAIGSHVVGRRRELPSRLLFLNQFGIAALLLLVYLTLDTWPYWAHVIRIVFQSNIAGFWAYYAAAFLVLFLLLVWPVGLMGATVPITFHEIKRDLPNVGRHSGLLFSCNTLGNLTGSLVGGIVFYFFMNNDGVFLTALVLAAASALLAARPLGRPAMAAGAFLVLVVLAAGLFTGGYDKSRFMIGTFRMRQPRPDSFAGPEVFFRNYFANNNLLFYRDGVSNTVAVTAQDDPGDDGQRQSRSILVNGKSDSSTRWDIQTLKLSAHLPALFCGRAPRSAMVVGLGTGVTAGELGLHPSIEQIEVAEISPTVIEALPFFTDHNQAFDRNPRARIHHGDAFRVIGRSDRKWDIIVSEPSNPWVTGVDMLFTDRFYETARSHLTAEGVFLQWVQIYDTAPPVLGMVLRTIGETFASVRVFASNGGDLLLLASQRELGEADVARAEAAWLGNAAVSASLAAIGIRSADALLLREIWSPDYVREHFRDFGLQTMDNPRLHYLAGREFFLGSHLQIGALLLPRTAAHWNSYLLARKHPGWPERCFDTDAVAGVIDELSHPSLRMELSALVQALTLKVMAGGACPAARSELFDDPGQAKVFATLRLMAGEGSERDWESIGMGRKPLRERAEALVAEVVRSRNWIAAFPTGGLLALLERGSREGQTPEERNWYLLQAALLRISEGARVEEVRTLAARLLRNGRGQITIGQGERVLLREVDRYLGRRAVAGG